MWLSESYLPHAWPVSYRKSVGFGVVGLGTFGSTLVVPTAGHLYAGSCTSPGSFVPQKVTDGHACVSKRSVLSLAGGVAYASSEGINVVSMNGWSLASDSFFTDKQWQALKPESMSAYRLGNRYCGFYDTGTVQRGFIFDPVDRRSGLIYIDVYGTAGYNDPKRDALYLQIGNNIQRWDGGTTLRPYIWKSKLFTLVKPINPAVGQVISAEYPVTFKLYADGNLKATKTVLNGRAFKLPAGYKASDFEIQLEGTSSVRGVAVAESVDDLKQLVV